MAENTAVIKDEAFSQRPPSLFAHRPEDDSDDISAQVADAGRLLGEANRKGIRVPDDVVAVIFMVREVQGEGRRVDAAHKTRFWNAYSVLQNIIKPAARARRLYRIVFYVTLILVLTMQCYFTVGVATRDQIQRMQEGLYSLTGQLEAARGQAPVPGDLQELAAQRSEEVISGRIAQLGADRDAYHVLAGFLIPFIDGMFEEDGAQAPARTVQALRLATLSLTLDFLAKYVLPALYGLLGACAFVLRQLSDEMGKLRFAHDRQVQYTLRLNIGLLGGLAIGWFINPDESAGVIANLSPLALAFVAGYGSDLLFALLDRIVAAFVTPRDSDATGKTVEERVGGLQRVTEVRTETRVAGGEPAEDERAGTPDLLR